MRRLKSYTEEGAERELRADEVLVPAGGITLCGHELLFFAAGSDEDYMTKDQKLQHRRQKRKQKHVRHHQQG